MWWAPAPVVLWPRPHPPKKRRRHGDVLMLAQHRRRWTNIKTSPGERPALAGQWRRRVHAAAAGVFLLFTGHVWCWTNVKQPRCVLTKALRQRPVIGCNLAAVQWQLPLKLTHSCHISRTGQLQASHRVKHTRHRYTHGNTPIEIDIS